MNIPRSILLSALTTALLPACGDDSGDATTEATAASTGGTTTGAGTTGADPTTDPTTTGGTSGGGAADCGFDPGLVFARDALVFQLASADGATCVWLERRDDSLPDTIYKAVPYTLLEFKAGHDGAVARVTDLAALTWESTHHNWTDVATAQSAGVRYRLEDWYTLDQGGEAFTDKWALFARDAATDAALWGPVLLYPHAE